MTLFEYISVANAIILSFAVIRVLDGLPHALDATRRSWVHLAFVIVNAWSVATFWWASWSYSAVSEWTYPKFLLLVAAPVLLYSIATTLVSADPGGVASWRDYFLRVHRRFFAQPGPLRLLP